MLAVSRAASRPVPSARARLHRLDACLDRLERANLCGATRVTAEAARLVAPLVPAVRAGMPVVDAIEAVLEAQAGCMLFGAAVEPPAPTRPAAARRRGGIDAGRARALTERIRHAAQELCLLLAEAHSVRAWAALGHPSWSEYVRVELGMSRTRSYELLDQATVIRALAEAAGVDEMPAVSAYAAHQVKPRLAAVAAEVRARTAGLPPAQALRTVAEVVDAERAAARPGRLSVIDGDDGVAGPTEAFEQALQAIAAAGDPVALSRRLPPSARPAVARRARRAAAFLDTFARACAGDAR